CIFQVGVVETLYSLGIRPAACLGVSGGAWNAAAVAVGNWQRLRFYWRCFVRWPYIDLFNLGREHSPFIWTRLHRRAFTRYLGALRAREVLLGERHAQCDVAARGRAPSWYFTAARRWWTG